MRIPAWNGKQPDKNSRANRRRGAGGNGPPLNYLRVQMDGGGIDVATVSGKDQVAGIATEVERVDGVPGVLPHGVGHTVTPDGEARVVAHERGEPGGPGEVVRRG